MTHENRRRNLADEVARGEEALRAARALFAAGLCNDAIGRAYYAVHYFARALLITLALEPKTHTGLLRLLALHFTSRLGDSAVTAFARLQSRRQAADYDTTVRFSSEDAASDIESAEGFALRVKTVLAEDGWRDGAGC